MVQPFFVISVRAGGLAGEPDRCFPPNGKEGRYRESDSARPPQHEAQQRTTLSRLLAAAQPLERREALRHARFRAVGSGPVVRGPGERLRQVLLGRYSV